MPSNNSPRQSAWKKLTSTITKVFRPEVNPDHARSKDWFDILNSGGNYYRDEEYNE